MSTYLIKGASLLGERVADILIETAKLHVFGQDLEARQTPRSLMPPADCTSGSGRYSYSPAASPDMRLLKPLRPVLARRL